MHGIHLKVRADGGLGCFRPSLPPNFNQGSSGGDLVRPPDQAEGHINGTGQPSRPGIARKRIFVFLPAKIGHIVNPLQAGVDQAVPLQAQREKRRGEKAEQLINGLQGLYDFGKSRRCGGLHDHGLPGRLEKAYLIDDYAQGKDTGIIDLVLVGDIDAYHLNDLTQKTERYIHRKIRSITVARDEFKEFAATLESRPHVLLWEANATAA